MTNVIDHPTTGTRELDRLKARENLARQLRTNQMMRESARERINATQIIEDIGAIDIQLRGSSTVGQKMLTDPVSGKKEIVDVEIPVPLDREIISALKARADIKFKLLGKVLPDLKATESISHSVHDHNHNHLHAPVSNVEMATRLQLWQQDIAKSRNVVKVIGPPTEAAEVELAQLSTDEEYDWL